ncbi:hypothetical protein TVAG_495430 [Trichomonas vaginalis G3]|uniref:Uncharacterized protein n=1 Tax=Trichomonas vaginalis (strain ATCC PRA-98 / G3) TaxID=412133 RepID=A2DVI6_TRIV3|nr:hypothetical protein TVAGG3_0275440 [Trichomonas vaginalis G3]EAY15528.1 hypothetical protein TVAG_495430 [Trichomonas vaginalis G3]KAI5526174.1 hypothetical protein TVAGG3_0275440 [Trichomonas vaginalis G3]|eukprot:XP_001327751.1 hypothetical protein [Trichomonas vaginalis G3]
MTEGDFPASVQINLVIHRDVEDIKIGFPFDTVNDEIDSIVAELKQTLGLSGVEEVSVKNSIRQQISAALSKSLTEFKRELNMKPQDEELSDELEQEIFDDPEYQALLERHKAEIAALEEQHLKQQRELMNTSSPSSIPKVVDDLIVFS